MTTNVSALSGARQQGPPANISGAEPAASATGPHWVPTVPARGALPLQPPLKLRPFSHRLSSVRSVWHLPPPGSQCEVFISQIPRDTYEDVLIPLFGSVGPLWEFRLIMNFSGQNRGFAYAKYSSPAVVSDAVHLLNGHWLEASLRLSVRRSTEKSHLCIGELPASTQPEPLLQPEAFSCEATHATSSPLHAPPPPRLARPPSRDAIEFCKAVGEPAVPQTPPPPSSSSCVSSLEGHLTPSGSLPCPMALLCELCEAKGVGKPHYDVKLSHAVPKGFMFFFYDVSVPGITLDFKGVVMILPGPSVYATLREAHQAVALQVLQKICNN
ncbi:hypothetical protein NQZ68_030064 [Dissostichus eleginoides]|nr:hypothetical protein NQZ68_030064 [Dissostichus eleginoides]